MTSHRRKHFWTIVDLKSAAGTYAGVVSLCMAFAWLFAQATEKQTPKVRRWLKQTLLAR
ncbi:MAG: hypothetical protein ACKOPM_00990 [Novosphingobium sp.]